MAKRTLNIDLDKDATNALNKLLKERQLTIDVYVSLLLQASVNEYNSTKTLGLDDRLLFGKFAGQTVENVVRVDPRYIKWLMANGKSIKFETQVVELLESFNG